MKINANDQLDLNGYCLRGCENETSIYTYQLFMLNSSSAQWIPFTVGFYSYLKSNTHGRVLPQWKQ